MNNANDTSQPTKIDFGAMSPAMEIFCKHWKEKLKQPHKLWKFALDEDQPSQSTDSEYSEVETLRKRTQG